MTLTEEIIKYLKYLLPIASYIVVFLTPIYMKLGEYFAVVGLLFLGILPNDSFLVAYIIAGAFIVLGTWLGIKTDPERKKEQDSKQNNQIQQNPQSSNQPVEENFDLNTPLDKIEKR